MDLSQTCCEVVIRCSLSTPVSSSILLPQRGYHHSVDALLFMVCQRKPVFHSLGRSVCWNQICPISVWIFSVEVFDGAFFSSQVHAVDCNRVSNKCRLPHWCVDTCQRNVAWLGGNRRQNFSHTLIHESHCLCIAKAERLNMTKTYSHTHTCIWCHTQHVLVRMIILFHILHSCKVMHSKSMYREWKALVMQNYGGR